MFNSLTLNYTFNIVLLFLIFVGPQTWSTVVRDEQAPRRKYIKLLPFCRPRQTLLTSYFKRSQSQSCHSSVVKTKPFWAITARGSNSTSQWELEAKTELARSAGKWVRAGHSWISLWSWLSLIEKMAQLFKPIAEHSRGYSNANYLRRSYNWKPFKRS